MCKQEKKKGEVKLKRKRGLDQEQKHQVGKEENQQKSYQEKRAAIENKSVKELDSAKKKGKNGELQWRGNG